MNPLQDDFFSVLMSCRIGKFVKIVLSVQIAVLGVIGWDSINWHVPLLRAFVGFLYLSFVPGLVMLRAFGVRRLGVVQGLMLTIGLSLFFLMVTGFLMNTLYPAMGFDRPLSVTPLLITISGVVMSLLAYCSLRRDAPGEELQVDFGGLLSARTLFLSVPPVLAVAGVYLANNFNTNIGFMVMVLVIAFILVAVASGKFIPSRLYPLAILSITLSLLYHEWMLSPYIWGRDIHAEFYFSNLVLNDGRWSGSAPSLTNGMLSIVLLPPVYSLILGMDLTWVFKLVLPFFFSFIPCGLYWILQRQMDCRIAFLSCFFFVSMGFFDVWLISIKQLAGELFIVLLVMLLVSPELNRFTRASFGLFFSLSLIVSHYGSSYAYLFCLAVAWVIAAKFLRHPRSQNAADVSAEDRMRLGEVISPREPSGRIPRQDPLTISFAGVALFFTLALTWYYYVSGSSSFDTLVDVGSDVSGSLATGFLNPESAQGLGMILTEPHSWFGQIERYVQLTIQLFIVIGVLIPVISRRYAPLKTPYVSFSFSALILLVMAVVLPHFSSAIYTPRLYSIALIFVAPFSIIGGLYVARIVMEVVRIQRIRIVMSHTLKLLSILLLVVFLLNTGFLREVADGPPSSIPMSKERMMESGSIAQRASFYYDYNVFNQDFQAVRWLSESTRGNPLIYSDSTASSLHSYGMFDPFENRGALTNTTVRLETGAYAYLGYANLVGGILFNFAPYHSSIDDIRVIEPLRENSCRLFSNGGSELLMG